MQNKKLKCVAFIFKLMRNLALLQMSEGCSTLQIFVHQLVVASRICTKSKKNKNNRIHMTLHTHSAFYNRIIVTLTFICQLRHHRVTHIPPKPQRLLPQIPPDPIRPMRRDPDPNRLPVWRHGITLVLINVVTLR